MVSKIRSDFDGVVLVHSKAGAKFLAAGDALPTGVKLPDELVEKTTTKAADSDAGSA